MEQTRTAGGCLLIAPIVGGFLIGMVTGDAMRGVVIGTGIGIAIAIGHWLMTRRDHRD